ncbi:hypothetical protein FRC18_011713 [Serendipita sp. 400]|nr:hypothetical protein FRC18_011713 [Serendipita sp. 400]
MPEFTTTTTAYAPPISECSYNLLAHNLRAGRLCVLSTVSDYVHPQLHSSTGPSSPTPAQKCGDDITIIQLTSPVMFFEAVYRSGSTFVDREGIKLREGSGLKLLERMEEIERDP